MPYSHTESSKQCISIIMVNIVHSKYIVLIIELLRSIAMHNKNGDYSFSGFHMRPVPEEQLELSTVRPELHPISIHSP